MGSCRSWRSSGSGHAMTVAVAVAGAITVACLGLVWLLPKSAPADRPGPA